VGLEWVWGLLRQVSPLLHKTTLTTVPIPKEHPSPRCVSLPNLVLCTSNGTSAQNEVPPETERLAQWPPGLSGGPGPLGPTVIRPLTSRAAFQGHSRSPELSLIDRLPMTSY